MTEQNTFDTATKLSTELEATIAALDAGRLRDVAYMGIDEDNRFVQVQYTLDERRGVFNFELVAISINTTDIERVEQETMTSDVVRLNLTQLLDNPPSYLHVLQTVDIDGSVVGWWSGIDEIRTRSLRS